MYPKNTLYRLAALSWLVLLCGSLTAQTEPLYLPAPNTKALRQADAQRETTRFAAPLLLDIAPAPAPHGVPLHSTSAPATYAYENGEWTWSQTFVLPGAHGLGLFVDRLDLPQNGRLTLTNTAGQQGPFYQADASAKKRLFTGLLPGQTVTLTYRGPLPETTPFHLWRIDHVYRPERWYRSSEKNFGGSDECQVNANCTAGDGWDDEKRSAGRINLVVEEGLGFCSGNLINNTARDGRPLLLTGFHCMDGFTPLYDLWSVDFDYTGIDCTNPAEEPVPQRYVGVEQLAGRQETDFLLLEITDGRFMEEDHYFAGWDRSEGNFAAPVRHFHHPFGDIQKIGVSDAGGAEIFPRSISWGEGRSTPPNHHFALDYGTGSFMVGSSGSGFFNQNRHLIGSLNGGQIRCPGSSRAFIGRLSLSWAEGTADSTQLAPWLDPLGTAPMTLDGENLLTRIFAQGQVVDLRGRPVAGATVKLQWSETDSLEYSSDEQGFYRGERPVGIGAYVVSAAYAPGTGLTVGVDVGDIIAIRSHILTLDTLSLVRQLASDVNGSGTVRVSDITRITRAILGVGDWGDRPNYLVLPIGLPLDPLPTTPNAPIGIQLNRINERELNISFLVVKTGDANE